MEAVSKLSSLQIAFISKCEKTSKDLAAFLFLFPECGKEMSICRSGEPSGHSSTLLNTQSRKLPRSLTAISILL